MDRGALHQLLVTCPTTGDEREHFEQCPTCGQWFDCRRLGDVLHHDDPQHERIPEH